MSEKAKRVANHHADNDRKEPSVEVSSCEHPAHHLNFYIYFSPFLCFLFSHFRHQEVAFSFKILESLGIRGIKNLSTRIEMIMHILKGLYTVESTELWKRLTAQPKKQSQFFPYKEKIMMRINMFLALERYLGTSILLSVIFLDSLFHDF